VVRGLVLNYPVCLLGTNIGIFLSKFDNESLELHPALVRVAIKNKSEIIADDYFGATWDQDAVFVSCGNKIIRFTDAVPQEFFRSDTFIKDIHQIYYRNDYLYVCNTGLNDICRLNTKTFSFEFLNLFDYSENNHINSFQYNEGYYYICLHNHNNPSVIKKYDEKFRHVMDYNNIGNQNHNILINDGILYTHDSFGGFLMCVDVDTGKVLERKNLRPMPTSEHSSDFYFGKGLAKCKDYFYVGLNYFGEGEERNSSLLVVLDEYLDHVCSHKMLFKNAQEGISLKDIRICFVEDVGHNGITNCKELIKLTNDKFSEDCNK